MHSDNGHPESSSPIIRLVKVRKSFGRQRVLRTLNLDVDPGITTVVLGPSGCGKSVMLKHIVGLLKPDSGEVWYGDVRIDTLSERRLGPYRRDFGFLFQQSALFDSMTVGDNVAFPLREHTSMSTAERTEQVERVVGMVGLADTLQKMPADLSGGQRKRIALARAIVLQPKVILYDEPTTGLDPIRADVINELILKLKTELDVTSIVVTHDITSAFKVADTMVMLYNGKVILHGAPEAFRDCDDPTVVRFLNGEATADELAGITGHETDPLMPARNP